MNKDFIKLKIEKIIRDVFDNESITIDENTSAQDIAEWDSLTNIQLMLKIQKDFNIKFSMEEMMKQENVGSLINTIYEKINII